MPLALSLLLLASPAAATDDDDGPFSIELSAGVEHDSNVAVLELDAASGEGDLAALVDLGLAVELDPTERLSLKLGYDFSQSLHETFDAFDLRVHRGSGELRWDFGRTELGLAAQFADAALDGDGFLVLQRTAPSLSHLFGSTLYLRLEAARADKEFAGEPGRDATADDVSLDAFVFLDGVSRYLVLGYRDRDEDADDDTLDYSGGTVKLRFVQRLGDRRRVKLEAGARRETREYETAAVPLGEPREDERIGAELELEWPLASRGFLRARAAYDDNRSTLASVDFDETTVSLEIGGRF